MIYDADDIVLTWNGSYELVPLEEFDAKLNKLLTFWNVTVRKTIDFI